MSTHGVKVDNISQTLYIPLTSIQIKKETITSTQGSSLLLILSRVIICIFLSPLSP